ncbi:MAG TPA: hypothetical protein VG711_06740 [Phycisphaerales bacterium]|nr:hypothetical protein [Phycisphaerales bacterium]
MKSPSIALGTFLALLAFDSPLQPPPLNTQTADWLRANLAVDADSKIASKLPSDVDSLITSGRNIRIILDAELARDHSAHCALTWGGHLVTLKLTDNESRLTGVSSGGARVAHTASSEAKISCTPLPIELSDIKLDHPDALNGDTDITGTFSIKAVSQLPAKSSLVLRVMTYHEEGFNTSLRFLDELPSDGKLTFLVPAPNTESSPIHFGPTPIIIDVLATDKTVGEGLVASNAVSIIADLIPDAEGYIRTGLDLMNGISRIFESVTDEASAKTAIEDYKALVLRNKALGEVFERLGNLPPDLEEKVSAKYQSQIDAATKKLQEQYERLNAAPYAGEAFFNSLDKAVKDSTRD